MKKLPNATKQDIIDLVDSGKIVNWKNRSYQVTKNNEGQYIIIYSDRKYFLTLDSEFKDSDLNSYFFEGDPIKTYYQGYWYNGYGNSYIKTHKKEQYSAPTGNWFESEDEAKEHFKIALDEAKSKIEGLKSKYYAFLNENNIYVSYTVDGDVYGVTDYMYMAVKINGYEIKFNLED
jgi:hypothetical protein